MKLELKKLGKKVSHEEQIGEKKKHYLQDHNNEASKQTKQLFIDYKCVSNKTQQNKVIKK